MIHTHWRRLGLYTLFVVAADTIGPIIIGLLGIPLHGVALGIVMGIVSGAVALILVGGPIVTVK